MKSMLLMENITKKFVQGKQEINALKQINLDVKQGEFISIIGPSGSGKSTFLTISGGLQQPTSGEIKERAKLRFKEIGFILQSSNLIPFLTIQEQFFLVDKINKEKMKSADIKNLLKSLDIYDLKDKYPRDLSGGERQRVAIGRALYNEPNLILADEPTASLDTEHAYEVVKLLVKEAHEKQKATVMVTHDHRMIKWSDRVFEMRDGELVETKDF